MTGEMHTEGLVDLVVLGAGPAGLAAAWRTAAAGHSVVVLEREGHVGGATASFEVAGLRVDHGSHRLHRSVDPRILKDLGGLLRGDLQTRERRGRIRLGGRWLRFPLEPFDAAASLPPSFLAGAAVDALAAPFRRPTDGTFAEQIRSGLGPTMLERFYGPYARKLWGLEPEEIDGEQARRRVAANSVPTVVRRLLRGRGETTKHFLYPRRGFGQISEQLATAAVGAGADLRLDSPAVNLRRIESGVEVETPDAEVAARRIWSTVPLAALARLWEGAPDAVADHARRLDSRGMVLIYLVLDTPRYTRYDAHYLPEGWTPVTRISEPKNYRDSDADPSRVTVLCAELPCRPGDGHWRAGDEELSALAVDALAGADLPPPPVVDVATRRLPSAYPIYRCGYRAHLEALEGWAEGIDPLLTFGRQGLFAHDNTHHALAMAYAAADALRSNGDFDEAAWSEARESFRSHTVED